MPAKKTTRRNSVKPSQSVPKKRKRRRKGRYRTGTHKSPKCLQPIKYRSGWELEVCRYLDNEPSVASYEYESVIIPYVSNIRTGRIRKYYPDFLVTYDTGKRVMIEVKRKDKLADIKVMKKAEAGRLWSQQNGATYELWTNTIIEALRRINKATLLEKKPARKRKKAAKSQ